MDQLITAMFGAIAGGFVGFFSWLILKKWLKNPIFKTGMIGIGALGGSLFLQQVNFSSPAVEPEKLPETSTLPQFSQSDTNQREKSRSGSFEDGEDEPKITLSLGLPLLNDLAKRDPAFAKTVEAELLNRNPSAGEIDEYAFTVGISETLKYIPRASDEALIELVEGLAYITNQLVTSAPRICYAWYYGAFEHEKFDFLNYRKTVGDSLLALQFKLFSNIVETVHDELPLFDQAQADAAVNRASFEMLQFAGFENSGLITGEAGPRNRENNDEYSVACQARFVLYQSLLSEENKADAIRQFFSSSN